MFCRRIQPLFTRPIIGLCDVNSELLVLRFERFDVKKIVDETEQLSRPMQLPERCQSSGRWTVEVEDDVGIDVDAHAFDAHPEQPADQLAARDTP